MGRRKGSPGKNDAVVHAIGGSRVKFCAIYIRDGDKPNTVDIGYSMDSEALSGLLCKVWVRDWKMARRVLEECFELILRAERPCTFWVEGYRVTININLYWARHLIDVAARKCQVQTFSSLKPFEVTKGALRERAMERLGR